MTVTFCGHSEVQNEIEVRKWLKSTIQSTLNNEASLFLLGGYGAFDRLAASVVREFKTKHPHIESVLVLAYLDRKVDATGYDGTTYPPLESVPKRFAISHRNRWMVDQADVVIAYVTHDWGGAASTLKYAIKQKKQIIKYGGNT